MFVHSHKGNFSSRWKLDITWLAHDIEALIPRTDVLIRKWQNQKRYLCSSSTRAYQVEVSFYSTPIVNFQKTCLVPWQCVQPRWNTLQSPKNLTVLSWNTGKSSVTPQRDKITVIFHHWFYLHSRWWNVSQHEFYDLIQDKNLPQWQSM